VLWVYTNGVLRRSVLGVQSVVFANNWGWHSAFIMIAVLAVLILIGIIAPSYNLWNTRNFNQTRIPFFASLAVSKKLQTGFAAICFSFGWRIYVYAAFWRVHFLVNNIHISQIDLPMVFFLTGLSVLLYCLWLEEWLLNSVKFYKIFTAGSIISIFYHNSLY